MLSAILQRDKKVWLLLLFTIIFLFAVAVFFVRFHLNRVRREKCPISFYRTLVTSHKIMHNEDENESLDYLEIDFAVARKIFYSIFILQSTIVHDRSLHRLVVKRRISVSIAKLIFASFWFSEFSEIIFFFVVWRRNKNTFSLLSSALSQWIFIAPT